MATTTQPSTDSPRELVNPADDIPPLENGDRLTRPEFERRYDAMPHLKKAELINGVVYIPFIPTPTVLESRSLMGSPVSFMRHSQPHADLMGWLSVYRGSTPGVGSGDNGSIRLDLDNMPQPDAFLLVMPAHGGLVQISEDDYVVGAPDFVAEVASSSAGYDLHAKLDLYRRHGVREYLVMRTRDRAIDWFALREGRYEPFAADEVGRYRSEVFPGLWLDPAALLRGDLAAVFEVLRQGLATPEHAAFVARLQATANRPAEADRGP